MWWIVSQSQLNTKCTEFTPHRGSGQFKVHPANSHRGIELWTVSDKSWYSIRFMGTLFFVTELSG